MKKNTYNTDGLSAEDRALNTFAELMIEKIRNLQEDWKKPLFSPQVAQLPKNLNGRNYNGMNSIVLMLMQEKNGWQTSRYATFDRIVSLNFTKMARRLLLTRTATNSLVLASTKEKRAPRLC